MQLDFTCTIISVSVEQLKIYKSWRYHVSLTIKVSRKQVIKQLSRWGCAISSKQK